MRPTILVFGEGPNDTRSIVNLAKILDSRMVDIDISPRRDPIIHLRRTDLPETRRKTADAISNLVKAELVRRRVLSVIAHQDADCVEPAHEKLAEQVEHELSAAGVPQPVAAIPAFELEAWLMLFPEALKSTRSCWRALPTGSGSTGTIVNAKEALCRMLRPAGRTKCPDYVESDSVKVTESINAIALDMKLLATRSKSLERFRQKLGSVKI